MSGDSIAPVTPSAPAAPPPVADAPRARADTFDSWLSSRSQGTELATRTEAAPIQHQTTTAPLAPTEHVAETMSEADVAALDQHWAALRGVVKPEHVPEFAKALQAGELPQQLQSAVVRFQHRGQEMALPVSELIRGNMRLNEYSRRMNELKELQQRQDQFAANLTQMFQTWDRPAEMLDSMRRLNKFAQFEAAAMELARHRLAEARMTPEQREAKRLREALQERDRLYAERLAALEARERSGQQAAKTDNITKALAAWVPGAFQKHGIPDFPAAAEWFKSNLDSIWHYGDLTPQLVDDAAALTAEQYREALRQHTAGQQQAAQAAPAGPRPLPVQAAPGAATFTPAQATRMRPSSFDDHIKSVSGRR